MKRKKVNDWIDRVLIVPPKHRPVFMTERKILLMAAGLMILAIFLFLHHSSGFQVKATRMSSEQADMQSQIDDLQADQAALAAEVEAWPGITVLTEETIPSMAVPAETEPLSATMSYVGEFWTTAYCPCEKCCGKSDGITASGIKAVEGVTVAADPDVFPYGTVLFIEGIGERIVQDCGGDIGPRRLDIFYNDHNVAYQYGTEKVNGRYGRMLQVWIIEEEAP